MKFKVLSPMGIPDSLEIVRPSVRVQLMGRRKIGLFSGFKEHWPRILRVVGEELKRRYEGLELSEFHYPKDCVYIGDDPVYLSKLKQWLNTVDAVITGHGDAGSCALFLAYNSAAIERLGKPVVMLTNKNFVDIAKTGATAKGVPYLRVVGTELFDFSPWLSLEGMEEVVRPEVLRVLPEIVSGLTSPIQEVSNPLDELKNLAESTYEGTIEEINDVFYQRGWRYGVPIMPPTEEAVARLLEATELPPEHTVCFIPPRHGRATVYKIAINAAMAGCKPPHFPILLAAVEALAGYPPEVPGVALEGYICSVASWAPMLVVSGPVVDQVGIAHSTAAISSYNEANFAIAHALSLTILNIGGVRPGKEDMSCIGHEGRIGFCIGESVDNPWGPLHVERGFDCQDSTVTLFWPNERRMIGMVGEDVQSLLKQLCENVGTFGFNPGAAIIMPPKVAYTFYNQGWRRKDIVDYIIEYARKPAGNINVRWLKGNHHAEKLPVPLPMHSDHQIRRIFYREHVLIIVSGAPHYSLVAVYGGGGDHGGPVTKSIKLPQRWKELLKKYPPLKRE